MADFSVWYYDRMVADCSTARYYDRKMADVFSMQAQKL